MKYLLFALCCLTTLLAKAQTDDVMIVEYIDSKTGSGYGVTIVNPTTQPINLTTGRYIFKMQDENGRVADSVRLTGVLAPGAVKYIGNTVYCNSDCSGSCDFTTANATGINGNEKVAIMKGPNRTFVDMVARWNDNTISGYRVGGVNNALLETRLERLPTNCTRYNNISGSGPNSWPSSSTSNVIGWTATKLTNTSNKCMTTTSFTPSFNTGNFSLGPDTSLCGLNSYTITAPPLSGATLTWSNGLGTQSISVRNSGKYWATYSNGLCTVTDTIKVTFGTIGNAGLGADKQVCLGQPVILKPASRGVRTRWSNGATTDSIRVTTAGSYSVIVTPASGCESRDTIVVKSDNPTRGFLGPDLAICGGDSVTLSSTVAATAGLPIVWSTGPTSSTLKVGTSGTIVGTLVNGSTCLDKDTIIIAIQPAITDSLPSVITTCDIQTEVITAPAGYAYFWNTGATTQTITPGLVGKYEVRLSRNGCSRLTATSLKLGNCAWTLPNFLTPNQDGQNDDFRPTRESVFLSAEARFYNRYGVELGRTTDPNIRWKAEGLPSGSYFYVVKATLQNGTQADYRGWVEVLK